MLYFEAFLLGEDQPAIICFISSCVVEKYLKQPIWFISYCYLFAKWRQNWKLLYCLLCRGLPSKERLCLVHTESYFPGKQKSNTQLSLYFCTQHHIPRRAKRAWWTDTSLLARWVVKMYFYFFASTWVAQVSNQKMNASTWSVKFEPWKVMWLNH